MTLLKASRMPLLAGLLCLLLLGFAGASYGAVRFDVVPSPTEVINSGRSEVVGSVNMIVRGAGNVTGTAAGGNTQIGLIYTNPSMQIDNTTTSGIKIVWSSGFGTAAPTIVLVENFDLNGAIKPEKTTTGEVEIGYQAAENGYLILDLFRTRIKGPIVYFYDSRGYTGGKGGSGGFNGDQCRGLAYASRGDDGSNAGRHDDSRCSCACRRQG